MSIKKIKILFVALAQSTHTHSWINLLDKEIFDVRLFGVCNTRPPDDFNCKTYIFEETWPFLSPNFVTIKAKNIILRLIYKFFNFIKYDAGSYWMKRIINSWKPDIVHTLGLDPCSRAFLRVKELLDSPIDKNYKWVVTVRGGPELALHRLISDELAILRKIFSNCDALVADNMNNYNYARDLGLLEKKACRLGVVPGSGGVDVERLSEEGALSPSLRERIILWPKAYECPASKALPVLEALKMCWEDIQPCHIYLTASSSEVKLWFQSLPSKIKKSCTILNRVPHEELLPIMVKSRVLLAPSLIDGIPNILYEAMAAGAFPIVSPIDTLTDIFKNERNVLYARNLFPLEIAEALVRSMNDDQMIDDAAVWNLKMVMKMADRKFFTREISKYYLEVTHS